MLKIREDFVVELVFDFNLATLSCKFAKYFGCNERVLRIEPLPAP